MAVYEIRSWQKNGYERTEASKFTNADRAFAAYDAFVAKNPTLHVELVMVHHEEHAVTWTTGSDE